MEFGGLHKGDGFGCRSREGWDLKEAVGDSGGVGGRRES